MKHIVSALAQVAGASSVSIGVAMIHQASGLICAGVFALAFGVALERGDR